MVVLEQCNVKLYSSAANKAEAIREAGMLLVSSEYIREGYIESMMGREKVANTFLGNGISIPHGLPKDRELILRTGISVVQVPNGVEWNPGEIVYLVVGIAARSDEHIEVLANLTNVLGDDALVQQLAKTENAADIVGALTKSHEAQAASSAAKAELADFSNSVEVTVQDKLGLHARPATLFVEIAKQFESEIHVRHGEKVANGKSMGSLLKLGVKEGSLLKIMAQGDDADAALKTLQEAVLKGLDEEEEEQPAAVAHGWTPTYVGETVPGVTASPGLAIGPVRYFTHRKIVVEVTAKDPAVEEKCLQEAIARHWQNWINCTKTSRNVQEPIRRPSSKLMPSFWMTRIL